MITPCHKTFTNEKGEYDSHAWPGGYPIYYITKDCGALCPKCCNDNKELLTDPDDPQWFIIAADINYEDGSLYCDNCSQRIESAYCEDEEDLS